MNQCEVVQTWQAFSACLSGYWMDGVSTGLLSGGAMFVIGLVLGIVFGVAALGLCLWGLGRRLTRRTGRDHMNNGACRSTLVTGEDGAGRADENPGSGEKENAGNDDEGEWSHPAVSRVGERPGYEEHNDQNRERTNDKEVATPEQSREITGIRLGK